MTCTKRAVLSALLFVMASVTPVNPASARVSLTYGFHRMLVHTQPLLPSVGLESVLAIGGNTLTVSMADLQTNPWGFIGLRMRLARSPSYRTMLELELRSTLPSRSTTINPWLDMTLSGRLQRFGWSIGAQAGLLMAPMPNQRPMGPVFMANAYGSVDYTVHPHLDVSLELGLAGDSGMLIGAVTCKAFPVLIAFVLPGYWHITQGQVCADMLPVAVKVSLELGGRP